MKSKHKFTPDQVVPMEERALLSHFPAALGPVTTLHLKGAFVLTSTTYSNLQSQINTAVASFEQSVIRLYNQQGGFTAAFDKAVGEYTIGSTSSPNSWSHAHGTLLAKLDAAMGSLEFKVPWGGSPGSPTGGLGLSNKTFLTTGNPANATLGGSVADLMGTAIETQEALISPTARTLQASMNVVGGEALGIVPAYIVTFGPQGARDFGLKNS